VAKGIEVHIWGGFGSQLYGLAIAYEIKRYHPKLNFALAFHNSGVTRRELEIRELVPDNFSLRIINDFSIQVPQDSKSTRSLNPRNIIKFLLIRFRIILNLDSSDEITKIMPWTLQLRGHYSHFCFSEEVIQQLADALDFDHGLVFPAELAIHFRLGDLIHLNKSSVTSLDLKNLPFDLDKLEKVRIFSESPDAALQRVINLPVAKIQSLGPEILSREVLKSCFYSGYFVGTNSKISFWIVIFRCYSGRGNNFLPKSQQANIYRNLDFDKRKLVAFF
jgi:hypothetical protein